MISNSTRFVPPTATPLTVLLGCAASVWFAPAGKVTNEVSVPAADTKSHEDDSARASKVMNEVSMPKAR